MTRYRGLTWDHPRGAAALKAREAGRERDAAFGIEWDVHPLEGFESHPIADLAARYDLIVLDHPHLGEALATGALQPLDAFFDTAELARWADDAVGPSYSSYTLDGRQWALPLDAASQVSAVRTDLLGEHPVPGIWSEIAALSRVAPVALSLSGPHALLTFASLCVALGEEPSIEPGDAFVSRQTAHEALAILRGIAARLPEGSAKQSPIALLERMTTTSDIAYCPLVYGYVNYSSPVLRFMDAPAAVRGGRRGTTIGGTGLAITARAEVTPELLAEIAWLLSPHAQQHYIPEHEGQPSSRSAWRDPALNALSQDFYRGTLETIEAAWVRPRHDGFIAFQSEASAIIRSLLVGTEPIDAVLDRLQEAARNTRSTSNQRERV
jgi:multiple sugar transport system substrate-binding protein